MLGAGLLGHGDELDGRRAADDGVVDEEDGLALELGLDRVELHADALAALGLAGHDERPADVAVLDEALAVDDAEAVGALEGDGAGRVGDGDDDVGEGAVADLLLDLGRELLAHLELRAVDRDLGRERVIQ